MNKILQNSDELYAEHQLPLIQVFLKQLFCGRYGYRFNWPSASNMPGKKDGFLTIISKFNQSQVIFKQRLHSHPYILPAPLAVLSHGEYMFIKSFPASYPFQLAFRWRSDIFLLFPWEPF